MVRALPALALALAACSVPDLDLSNRPCPCASGWECDSASNVCVPVAGGPRTCGACACAGDSCVDDTCTPRDPVVDLGVGSHHNCVVLMSGALYCWGRNDDGQLGLGDATARAVPARVGTSTDWAHARSGYRTTCAIARDGSRWCWGANELAQLGLGDTSPRSSPAMAKGGIAAVTLGSDHGCSRSLARFLGCWGSDNFSQLGLGGSSDVQMSPVEALPDTQWLIESAGQWHTCAVRDDGTLWCWGRNTDGEIGAGDVMDRDVPAQIGGRTDWASVSGGGFHTCGTTRTRELWCWGGNLHGQLGNGALGPGEELSPTRAGAEMDWSRVVAGYAHSCGLRGAGGGELFCWGDNAAGQLGIAGVDQDETPRRVDASEGQEPWVDIGAGEVHSCAIARGGGLWCWGSNDEGQLGVDVASSPALPTRVCL